MNVLDLFSGIGGFSLGLERAGMRTVAFCEIEPYCQAVLRKHWPGVPVFGDVRLLTRDVLVSQGIVPELICGGFPCQDISLAGKGAGLAGERSGLWSEFHRLIDEFRPRYAIIENVSALRSRGLDTVLGALAAIGYDAEWHCIPACAVGAPHRRDRIWIVAYAVGRELRIEPGRRGRQDGACAALVAEHGEERDVADPARLQPGRQEQRPEWERARLGGESVLTSDADRESTGRLAIAWGECGQWLVEPAVGRVADGVPSRVDRLRALGNAVVPQIPEIIGRAIMSACGDHGG